MSVTESRIEQVVEDVSDMEIVSLEDCIEKYNLQAAVGVRAEKVTKPSSSVDALTEKKKMVENEKTSVKQPAGVPHGEIYYEMEVDNLEGFCVEAESDLGDDKQGEIQIFSGEDCKHDIFYEDEVLIYSINGLKVHGEPVENGLRMLKVLKKKNLPVTLGLMIEDSAEDWRDTYFVYICLFLIFVGLVLFGVDILNSLTPKLQSMQ